MGIMYWVEKCSVKNAVQVHYGYYRLLCHHTNGRTEHELAVSDNVQSATCQGLG